MHTQYRVVLDNKNIYVVQFLDEGTTTWRTMSGRSSFFKAEEAIHLKNTLEDEMEKIRHIHEIKEIIDPPRHSKKGKKPK